MNITSATFTASSPNVGRCPETSLPEFAFIGRSNVGKSSLINMLAGIKNLAKVSGTPGKTRLINHFLIDDTWFLVDLPGIGFSKLPRCEQNRLKFMTEGYLTQRKNLRIIFHLVDSRHEPQEIDLEFIDWMIRHRLRFELVFTKTDKLSKAKLAANTQQFTNTIRTVFGIETGLILSSASNRTGKEEILGTIEKFLTQ